MRKKNKLAFGSGCLNERCSRKTLWRAYLRSLHHVAQ
jgi:hypothetical protein